MRAEENMVSDFSQHKKRIAPLQRNVVPNCGKTHDLRRRESCPAFRRTCAKCGKYNHLAAMCRSSALVDGNAHRQTARVVEFDETKETECDKIYGISDIAAVHCTAGRFSAGNSET